MTAEDLRCLCGSLVARVKKTAIELKCRRCKRVALIPLLKKDQRTLQESHPEVFKYQITFDHPPDPTGDEVFNQA
jgi:phage FluMu protein Com